MKQVFWTIGILTTQILILNHIQIYGFGTPLACVLPILLFPLDSPRWQILLSGFVIVLIEDIFINTPGVTAATFTLIAMIQPHLLKAVSSRDNEDKATIPSAQNLGWASYVKYILSACFILSVVFFTLESFSFFNYIKYLLSIASTWLMTAFFILAIESVRNSKA